MFINKSGQHVQSLWDLTYRLVKIDEKYGKPQKNYNRIILEIFQSWKVFFASYHISVGGNVFLG